QRTTSGQARPRPAAPSPAATIARDQLAASGAEPYKGAYVHVTGSPMMVSSIAAMEFATTCTDKSMPPQNGTTFGGFETAGGGQTLAIGLGFYQTSAY